MGARRLARWMRAARQHRADLLGAVDLPHPPDPAGIAQVTAAAARALARAETAIARVEPDAIVVATQHAVDVRAVLAIAHAADIPSVYFPHAPVESSAKYADLPTQLVGLRGTGEVDHYRALGVTAPLDVVGNPSIEIVRDPLPSPDGDPVFALPVGPAELLDHLLGIVEAAVEGPLVLAPHPRADRAWIERRCPPRWRVSDDESTFDLLARGPAYVLQHTSGVAWESLALGLPTIELNPPDVSVYPLISAPAVLFAEDAVELRRSIEQAVATGRDPAARRRLVEWAAHWCSQTGHAASLACAELVDRTASTPPGTGRVLDAWGAPGSTAA